MDHINTGFRDQYEETADVDLLRGKGLVRCVASALFMRRGHEPPKSQTEFILRRKLKIALISEAGQYDAPEQKITPTPLNPSGRHVLEVDGYCADYIVIEPAA
jgi:hypothetical protein